MEASLPSKQRLRYLHTPDGVRLDFPRNLTNDDQQQRFGIRGPGPLLPGTRPGSVPCWGHHVPSPPWPDSNFGTRWKTFPLNQFSLDTCLPPRSAVGTAGDKDHAGASVRAGSARGPDPDPRCPRRPGSLLRDGSQSDVPGDLPPPGPTVPGRPRSPIRAGSPPRRVPQLPVRDATSPAPGSLVTRGLWRG